MGQPTNKKQAVFDSKLFYDAVEDNAEIYYTWNIKNLMRNDLAFLEHAALNGKTLHEAVLSLGLDVAEYSDEKPTFGNILKTEIEQKKGLFRIYIAMPGTLRKHYPFMTALYKKFPYANIQYSAFQHNINSYNAFGGPWVGGIKQNELKKNPMYFVYFLSVYQNSFSIIPNIDGEDLLEDEEDIQEEIQEWADENVQGLINYKVIAWQEAKIVNIDWKKEVEYFSNKSNSSNGGDVDTSEQEEDNYFSERLEKLIAAAIADGVLTEKEKEIILRRAEKEGEDEDEVMMIIESRLNKLDKK